MASKNTVFVGCKLPNGLHLDSADADATPGMAPDEANRVTLNGTNSLYVNGILMPSSTGYGLTEVDADFFNDWMARHQDFPPVKQGLIFAVNKEGDAAKEAKSRADVKSGFEGSDPSKPGPGVTKDDGKTKG
jgi:hypothetical protein